MTGFNAYSEEQFAKDKELVKGTYYEQDIADIRRVSSGVSPDINERLWTRHCADELRAMIGAVASKPSPESAE